MYIVKIIYQTEGVLPTTIPCANYETAKALYEDYVNFAQRKLSDRCVVLIEDHSGKICEVLDTWSNCVYDPNEFPAFEI